MRIILSSLIIGLLGLFTFSNHSVYAEKPEIKVLLIDGQNNHNWQETTPVIEEILEKTGRFNVEISTCPAGLPRKPRINNEDKNDPDKFEAWQKEIESWEKDLKQAEKVNKKAWKKWNPDFHKFDVVVSNYNGQSWPKKVKESFEGYMKQGGGLVVIHAADNSFPEWEEYNKMIGVGGWGRRNEESGPMLRYRNNQWILDSITPGRGGTHGKQVQTPVINDMPNHPIMKGLPPKWMHVKDEIYGQLRGPAENITVLASSFSDEKDRGTGEQEPGLMVIDYHKGRVFHTIYGHSAGPMQGLGFQITLQRGTEWAATGEVSIPVPEKKLSATEATLAD